MPLSYQGEGDPLGEDVIGSGVVSSSAGEGDGSGLGCVPGRGVFFAPNGPGTLPSSFVGDGGGVGDGVDEGLETGAGPEAPSDRVTEC